LLTTNSYAISNYKISGINKEKERELTMNAIQSIRARLAKNAARGLSTVEYVIILVLIAAVAVATWTAFGAKLKGALGSASTKIGGELDTGKTAADTVAK
jgi:Flp pilus assembly pilin Flp